MVERILVSTDFGQIVWKPSSSGSHPNGTNNGGRGKSANNKIHKKTSTFHSAMRLGFYFLAVSTVVHHVMISPCTTNPLGEIDPAPVQKTSPNPSSKTAGSTTTTTTKEIEPAASASAVNGTLSFQNETAPIESLQSTLTSVSAERKMETERVAATVAAVVGNETLPIASSKLSSSTSASTKQAETQQVANETVPFYNETAPIDSSHWDETEDLSLNDHFSGCILWMDDNHRLEEWLAYHYYLLKFRYLVLNIDQFSRTSPQAIIDRWNQHTNMTIVVMHDRDYYPKFNASMNLIEKARIDALDRNASNLEIYSFVKNDYHRVRQREFYRACSKHLVQQNATWTLYHDTDEFLSFGHYNYGAFKKNHDTNKRKMENHAGYVLHRLNWIKRQNPPDSYLEETGLACFSVSRRKYCSKELSDETTDEYFTEGVVPKGIFNSTPGDSTEDHKAVLRLFDTLRYKYKTPKSDGQPKSIIDLSQRGPRNYVLDRWGYPNEEQGKPLKWLVHKPTVYMCRKEDKNRLPQITALYKMENYTLNHYLGTWESFSFRNDARQGGTRTYDIWENLAFKTRGEKSTVITPWLKGFVDLVGGSEMASYLLQDAGKFPDDYDREERIRAYNETQWNFSKQQYAPIFDKTLKRLKDQNYFKNYKIDHYMDKAGG